VPGCLWLLAICNTPGKGLSAIPTVQVSTHLSRDAARLLGLCPRATNWPQICAGQAAPPVHAPTMHQQHRQSILHRHPHPLIDHPLVHQGRWDVCVQIGATHVVPGLPGLAEPLKACDRMAATAVSQQNVLASCASRNPGWEHGAAACAPTTSRHPPSGHLLPAMTGTITHQSPRHTPLASSPGTHDGLRAREHPPPGSAGRGRGKR